MSEESKRTVKLFCPSISKAVQVVAHDEQRIDLGSIARTFGLEPATLMLNGHFISRGVDLIASSVTWKSLISFFSSRGLSTGTTGSGALVVDGKLSKSGSKRGNDSVNEIPSTMNCGYGSNSSKKTKLKDMDVDKGSGNPFLSNPFRFKRKQEDAHYSQKRFKVDNSGSHMRELTYFENLKTRLPCSFLGVIVNVKRRREEDIVLSASNKKIR
ncbi:hypothetical protein Lser_V15G26991 [Lactuca serriola]